MPSNKAFTLIEMLVAIAIIVVIVAVSIAALPEFLGARTLDAAVSDSVALLEEARQLTLASKDPSAGDLTGSQYGVYFDTNAPQKAMLFKGATYQSANVLKTVMYSGVTIPLVTFQNSASSNMVVFQRTTGATNNSGSITFQSQRTGKQKTITVAPQGHLSD